MQISDFILSLPGCAGKTASALFTGTSPLVVLSQAGSTVSISHWDASLGAQPTAAEIAAAVSAAPAAATPAALIAYAQARQAAIDGGGISVNIAAAGAAPQMLEVATDVSGKIKLLGMVQGTSLLAALTPGSAPIVNFVQPGGVVSLTQAQAQAVGLAAFAFAALTEDVLGAVLAAIAAGTITATAQIDDPTLVGLTAWPANS